MKYNFGEINKALEVLATSSGKDVGEIIDFLLNIETPTPEQIESWKQQDREFDKAAELTIAVYIK